MIKMIKLSEIENISDKFNSFETNTIILQIIKKK